MDGYNSALLQLCSESNVEAEGRKAALESAPIPPPKLTLCFSKFPELKQTYDQALSANR